MKMNIETLEMIRALCRGFAEHIDYMVHGHQANESHGNNQGISSHAEDLKFIFFGAFEHWSNFIPSAGVDASQQLSRSEEETNFRRQRPGVP